MARDAVADAACWRNSVSHWPLVQLKGKKIAQSLKTEEVGLEGSIVYLLTHCCYSKAAEALWVLESSSEHLEHLAHTFWSLRDTANVVIPSSISKPLIIASIFGGEGCMVQSGQKSISQHRRGKVEMCSRKRQALSQFLIHYVTV